MKKNRIPYVAIFLSTVIIGSMISINALKIEGFTIDADLKKSKFVDGVYDIPSSTVINLSDEKQLCPSGQCQVILGDNIGGTGLDLLEEQNFMNFWLDARLKDDITHADLTPKKQKLVEEISGMFACSFNDIIEENGKTKYICNDHSGGITIKHNSTSFPYTFSASFELPSRHLSLNASAIEQ
jgi:hypothetical protein